MARGFENVYGIPSMRILKYIGVFTPEPWQGYGFDENSKAVLLAVSSRAVLGRSDGPSGLRQIACAPGDKARKLLAGCDQYRQQHQ